MKSLEFRTITSESQIEIFLNKVESYTGVRLPLAYAMKSRIVGVFSQNQLVGGYMLVTSPEFRSFMFVPDKVKRSNVFFAQDKFQMMEVNGLWIGPGIKSPNAQFRVWMNLLKDILLCKKKYLLLMSNCGNKTIRKIHNMTAPSTLYEGDSMVYAGEKTHQKIRIAYTTRWKAFSNLPKYFMELQSRRSRAKHFETKNPITTSQYAE